MSKARGTLGGTCQSAPRTCACTAKARRLHRLRQTVYRIPGLCVHSSVACSDVGRQRAIGGAMKRREFLRQGACGVGAAWLGMRGLAARVAALPRLDRKFSATDTVTLGKTGIQTSRLAMGTGTVGSGHHSHQTDLGVAGLSALLLNGHDNGLRFFDAADSYGRHPHVAEALKHISRDKVTVLTKTWAP